MTPDDPRHGTQAGAVAHWRAGDRPCAACRVGALRAKKRRQLDELDRGEPANVPLGEDAHRVIATTNRMVLSRAIGMGTSQLRLYEVSGPEKIVRRATRDKILAFRRPWSPVGIQRRLRALTIQGWSMQALADRSGIYMTSLAEMRRNENIKFVRLEVATKILALWDEMSTTLAPDSHSSRETAARAAGRGWLPVHAWDDIDDPDEDPLAGDPDEGIVDEVAVERVYAGDTSQPTTRAERLEVLRRWQSNGRSLRSLEQMTGWNVARYARIAAAEAESEQVAS